MEFSRRNLLKIAGFGALVITFLPRVAMAAKNSLESLRTGVQPGNKTRLVIETALRPSYSISYPQNQLVINISNCANDSSVKSNIASGCMIRSVTNSQAGDSLRITANLSSHVAEIPKKQIMILEPTGDNKYRLVIDFAASKNTTNTTTTAAATTNPTKGRKPVIVIDAGHGGKDPGAIGKNGTKEKDIVLRVAKKLKTRLDESGYKTILTRDKDVFLNLDTRAGIAEKNHADLFLSLHANANPSRNVKGFSLYTLNKKASDEEARKLAEAENASDKIDVDGFSKFEPDIRNALSALQQHAVAELSMEFANGAFKSFRNQKIEQQPGPNVRQAPFAVLRATVPGALIELGHLSNVAEEKLLKSDSHQNKLVRAISRTISGYKFDV